MHVPAAGGRGVDDYRRQNSGSAFYANKKRQRPFALDMRFTISVASPQLRWPRYYHVAYLILRDHNMKNACLIILCVLLLVNICFEAANLYHRYTQRQPIVSNVAAGTGLDISDRPLLGNMNAPRIIVEFGDYECPYCLKYGKETFPMLRRKYIDQGTLKYAYADLPLPMHRNARMLANAALCAGKQNKYWEMHDLLIEKHPVTHSEVLEIAKSLGIDNLEFHGCLIGSESNNRIEKSIQQAKTLNVRTTPSFALGTVNRDGQVMVQKIIYGAQPAKVFEQAIGGIRLP